MTKPTEADLERARQVGFDSDQSLSDETINAIATALAETRKAGEAAGRKAALEECALHHDRAGKERNASGEKAAVGGQHDRAVRNFSIEMTHRDAAAHFRSLLAKEN